jgi:hypothetical protein
VEVIPRLVPDTAAVSIFEVPAVTDKVRIGSRITTEFHDSWMPGMVVAIRDDDLELWVGDLIRGKIAPTHCRPPEFRLDLCCESAR